MGLDIKIDIPERPMHALGNEEALDRALNNLLSNAIAYGADGHVIGITVRNDEANIDIDVWIVARALMNIISIAFLKGCIH